MHTMIRQGQLIASLARIVVPLRAPVSAAAARAVPYAAAAPCPRTIHSKLGLLESAIVDTRGRLFVTSQTWNGPIRGAVLRLDHPDAEAVPVTEGIPSPGELALNEHGQLIVGYGDNAVGGLLGNLVGRAGLLRIDPDTGRQQTHATGLSMANGIARTADGTIFASDDLGTHLDRVDPDGTVHRRWARVWSANGLAIDPTSHYLYAAQFFPPAAIRRIDITNPITIAIHARPPWSHGHEAIS